MKRGRDSFWAFMFRHRNRLVAVPLVYAFFSVRWEYEVDWIIWPAAASLCFAGGFLRAWARQHNAYAQGQKKALATTGPYAFVRNPLYLGNLLIIAAAGVASELLWFLPVVVGWAFLIYVATCKHEDGRLLVKYGTAYEAYRAEVPAWWPRAPTRARVHIKTDGFWKGLARQVSYASLSLLPFVVKELNPFHLWPHP